MRLQTYILEDYKKIGRGKLISEEEALKMIPKFSDAIKSSLKGNLFLSRYISKFTGKRSSYYYIDPKKGEPRVSASTSNYYTLIMDNSKKWSKYPKRSKSLICSVISGINEIRSSLYLVLPENGAKIGECQNADLWISFPNVDVTMNKWNKGVSFLLNMPNYTDEKIENKLFKRGDFDKSYIDFKKACKKFDNWVKNTTMLSIKEIQSALFVRYHHSVWIRKWKGEPIYEFFDNLLDPQKNEFKLVNIHSLNKNNDEAWTDAKSLMILGQYNSEDFLNKAKKLI
jgi:hypothetical protein